MPVKQIPFKTLKENAVFRRKGMLCFQNCNRKQSEILTFPFQYLKGYFFFQSTKFSTEDLKGGYMSVCAHVYCFCHGFM